MKKEIWIVSLFEPTPPDLSRPMRFMGFAEEAIKKGYKIRQFSSTFRHSKKIYRHSQATEVKVNDSYKVNYIHSPSYMKNISLKRVYSHYVYSKNLVASFDSFDKPEFILVAFPAISPAIEAVKWAQDHNVPVYLDIIDPWPDVTLRLIPTKLQPVIKFFLRPIHNQIRKAFSNATGIVAISQDYIDWSKSLAQVKKTGVFFPSVPFDEVQSKINSFKSEQSKMIANESLANNDKLRIVYAGNLGIAADIPLILRTAKYFDLKYPGQTQFYIAGSGDFEEEIKKVSSEIKNLEFLGRIGNDDLMKLYAHSDLGLAQYSVGATQSITYKLFDYLSAGLPILNSLMTEMADIINKNKLGFNNEPGDDKQLIENISIFLQDKSKLEEYKQRGLEFTRLYGDNKTVYTNMLDFFLTK